MNKHTLRKIYKEKRASLSEALRDLQSLDIANQSLTLPIWNKRLYHIFFSIENQNEVNTQYLLNILFGKDKNIATSKTIFEENRLKHFLLTDQTLIKINSQGIPEPDGGIPIEPQLIDVIFVPLLAYDIQGNRIGYGKGFYDRFFLECRFDVLKIGLSFFPPEKEISDISQNDIPLDYCITPQTIFKF
ncbi:5-formyltetrahydrofolate cyclo-ligase [Capnocytophaga catalasegens]|uniref:5-formyltetrahydrofolate cyclo-ligase n=1 Tax=Capnocytophaga catalasegens TaxID=1004260 RepID=A0AAV5ANV9_9FLAO|nr:5-formyltetrahydrofolate cyclo-ligase [Capnocytophaga catalasegens]GIZ14036.1 5-formyltetrahydrofolate cyclo-ligase [Capnocytophaga catalasegens]GJM49033.1 5-formyltetrahydrofolate cyclo-ligase [Capnocytophaga catalasegens]GJM52294.1 5-formyltetrahydrofolate cyclo-ligase [Capnocytophaga catalasegens]